MVKSKSYQIIWEDEALDYLKDQLDFISKKSAQAPAIIKNGILDKLKTIRTNPLICEADKFKLDNLGSYRSFVVYSYRISFKISDQELLIVRIRHTSQDPKTYEFSAPQIV